ncbi:MAG: hypothetical protein V3U57_10105 [Robiginitomaculum sp.]
MKRVGFYFAKKYSISICTQVLIIMVFVSCESTAHAGAWPMAGGKGQIITTNLYDRAHRAYDDTGVLRGGENFSKTDISIFYERGLSDKYTLVIQTGYQDIKFVSGDVDAQYKGVGESSIGMRRVLWQGNKTVLSTQLSAIFGSSPELISDADLGVGSTLVEGRILAGRSFKVLGRNGFAEAQAAWRLHISDNPDEIRLAITVGVRPVKKLQVFVQGFYAAGDGALNIARPTKRTKVQTSIVWDINEKNAVQLGAYQTIAGRNIVREKAVFIGSWVKF